MYFARSKVGRGRVISTAEGSGRAGKSAGQHKRVMLNKKVAPAQIFLRHQAMMDGKIFSESLLSTICITERSMGFCVLRRKLNSESE